MGLQKHHSQTERPRRISNRINLAKQTARLLLALVCFINGLALPGNCLNQPVSSKSTIAPTANSASDKTASLNSWSSLGLEDQIFSLAFDPSNPNVIYAGARGGLFKTTDGGQTWSNRGLAYTTALAVDFINPNTIYAGSGNGGECRSTFPFFKSTNGGTNWSNQNSPADCDISMIVMDPNSPNTLYMGSYGQYISSGSITLWKSIDGGANWNGSRDGNLASYGFAISPANSQILYATSYLSGLVKSTDGGATWNATGLTNTDVQATAVDPLNPNTLYVATFEYMPVYRFLGLLKSTDGGVSWFPINNGLTGLIDTSSVVSALTFQPDNTNTLYAGSLGGGVYTSTDGGANWSQFNVGLTNLYINALAIDSSGTNLYAATRAGVFRYQSAATCTAQISPTNQSFSSRGGAGSVNVTTGSQCNWTVSNTANWITVTSPASGTGSGTVTFEVRESFTGSPRFSIIVIAGRDFTVEQDGGLGEECSYFISSRFQTFSATGGTGTLNVSTDNHCAWQAVSNASWITITSNGIGIGIGAVAFSVSANTTGSGRKGAITIAGQTFSVKQKGD